MTQHNTTTRFKLAGCSISFCVNMRFSVAWFVGTDMNRFHIFCASFEDASLPMLIGVDIGSEYECRMPGFINPIHKNIGWSLKNFGTALVDTLFISSYAFSHKNDHYS